MLHSLVVSSHALELYLHLLHTVLKFGDLVLEFVFVAVQYSSMTTLSHHVLHFIYDIAPLIVDLASEVLERNT